MSNHQDITNSIELQTDNWLDAQMEYWGGKSAEVEKVLIALDGERDRRNRVAYEAQFVG